MPGLSVSVQFWVFFSGGLAGFLFSVFCILTPGIFGKSAPCFKISSREHLPFRCLNGSRQSVKGFVRLRIIQAFSQRDAFVNVSNPLMLFSLACMWELKDSMRLFVCGHFCIR